MWVKISKHMFMLFSVQYILQNRGMGSSQYDMNVIPAWKKGYNGKNVVVTIVCDGLERDHPDLIRNYVSMTFCLPSLESENYKRNTVLSNCVMTFISGFDLLTSYPF